MDTFILVGTYPAGSDMTVGDDTKAEISFFAHLSSSPMIPCRKPSTKKEKQIPDILRTVLLINIFTVKVL